MWKSSNTMVMVATLVLWGFGSPSWASCNAPNVSAFELTASLPVAGYQYDAVEHNGHVYVIGGWDGTAALDTVYMTTICDGRLMPWVLLADTPLPEVDQGPGVTVWDGHIYAALGNGNIYRAKINHDGSLSSWQAEPMAAAYHGGRLSLEAYAGYLYVFGGWNGPTFYDDVYVAPIDPNDGAVGDWSTTSPMPQIHQHTSVHFYNDRVYIAGGISSGLSILDSVYSAPVDPNGTGALGSWRQEADLPTTLWMHNSVLAGNRIYVFGGRTGYSSGASLLIYEGVIGEDGIISDWITVGTVPIGNHDGPGAVYSTSCNAVYLIGGNALGGSLTSDVVRTLSPSRGDINGDGVVNALDIDPFVELLTGG